jgi:hypothetical protein
MLPLHSSAAPGCTRPHSVLGHSFNLLSFIRYPFLQCTLVMPSLQSRMCAYFFQSEAPSLHITFAFQPPPRGRQSLKNWLEPPGPTSPVMPFYFWCIRSGENHVAHHSHSPYSVLDAMTHIALLAWSRRSQSVSMSPFSPATGYGGIKKATVWRVGRVLFAAIRCSPRRAEKRRQILKWNGNHRWEDFEVDDQRDRAR